MSTTDEIKHKLYATEIIHRKIKYTLINAIRLFLLWVYKNKDVKWCRNLLRGAQHIHFEVLKITQINILRSDSLKCTFGKIIISQRKLAKKFSNTSNSNSSSLLYQQPPVPGGWGYYDSVRMPNYTNLGVW